MLYNIITFTYLLKWLKIFMRGLIGKFLLPKEEKLLYFIRKQIRHLNTYAYLRIFISDTNWIFLENTDIGLTLL